MINKVRIVSLLKRMYPELKILKVRTIKTFKRNKVVVDTDKPKPWVKT